MNQILIIGVAFPHNSMFGHTRTGYNTPPVRACFNAFLMAVMPEGQCWTSARFIARNVYGVQWYDVQENSVGCSADQRQTELEQKQS